MKMLSIVLISLCLLSGCSQYNSPEVMSKNRLTLSGPGETVGTLPDGRRVSRYEIDMGADMHDHWIYVVDGSITKNVTVSNGKSSSNTVEVMVDGVKYSAPNMAEISDFK
jgi:major membrane immunogen (membrane-anchored lipoprotein)